MATYRKTMREALNEVYLGEDNMALLKKAAGGSAQKLKMKDGKVTMDSFTASAIMQVYKAINPKNKKTMENVVNTGTITSLQKLQSLAMRAIKSGDEVEHDGEELDEDGHTDVASAIRKCMTVTEDAQDINSKLQTMSTEDSLPSWWTNKLAVASNDMNKMRDYIVNPVQEEIELDEAKGNQKSQGMFVVLEKGSKNKVLGQFKDKKKAMAMLKKKVGSKVIQIGEFATEDDKPVDIKVGDELSDTRVKMSTKIKEEVELDESKKALKAKSEKSGVSVGILSKVYDRGMAAYKTGHRPGTTPQQWALARVNSFLTGGGARKADADLLKQAKLHKEEVELDEVRDIDPADVDDIATDDDVKAADKNIMMQMRKVISLRGNFKVEFGDKKKIKIDPKIARAVQNKYDSIKRPMDKQKFTNKIFKSYKDMLSALKEGFASDAQRRAAFASGYKEKGKKKKEDIDEKFDVKTAATKKGKISVTSFDNLKDAEKHLAGMEKKGHKGIISKDGKPVFRGTPAEIKKQMKDYKKKYDKIGIGEDITVTAATDGGISQRDLDYVQKELRRLGIKDAVVDQNEMDKNKIDVQTKMSDDKVKRAFDKSKMTVNYEHIQMEGTWALPDTPKLKAGLKKLMMKKIPLGKDGETAIDKIGDYIGDDGLYDDLYTASKKDGEKADARPLIRGWMDREFVDSWKKYRIETTTILNRIGQKIQERKNG